MMQGALASEWERCRHYIEAALCNSPGLEDIEAVEGALDRGGYMLWTGANCAAITDISIYPSRKVLTIVHGGGDKSELIGSLFPRIEEFAALQGCDLIAVTGRKGWEREGEKHGFRFGYVTMIKDLLT